MLIEAILTVFRAIKDLLSAYDDYIVKPTKENRQTLINHIYELENASDELFLQMDKAQREIEKGNTTTLQGQFTDYNSTLDSLFNEVRKLSRQIIKDIEISGFFELDASAMKLDRMCKETFELWKRLGEAILTENPRHIRGFFKYVCDEIKKLVGESKQLAISAIEVIDKKVIHQSQKSTFSYQHIQESNTEKPHEPLSEEMPSETEKEDDEVSQEQLRQQYLLEQAARIAAEQAARNAAQHFN
jgi:tRNA nucleotidyltransferase (CCA-adding enzyme)